MLHIGCHLSSSKGFLAMGKTALSIGADTFQFFTRNPRGGKAKAVKPEDAAALNALMQEHNFAPILAHAPYTMNPCAADEKLLEFAQMVMEGDLAMLEYVPGNMYNFHPGSHLREIPEDDCLKLIAESVNAALSETEGVTAVIENTAGQGSNLGYSFEQIARIMELIEDQSRVGVCIAPCHSFAAGYDLKSEDGYEQTMNAFERIIGFRFLRGGHLNDSQSGLGGHLDRHNSIGKGELGLEPFRRLMNDRRFDNIPMVLETIDETLWPEEIKLLYSFAGE